MESAKQIELRAADWLARRDSGDWTDADQSQLQTWLEQATAHRIAYLRLETVWIESQRLVALAAGLPPGSGEANGWTLPLFEPPSSGEDVEGLVSESIEPALPMTQAQRYGRPRVSRHLTLAASVLVVVGVGYLGWQTLFAADPY
ncbi:FecR/PupR family sigma factor regulator, partial [Steroidobacter sp.]|uniref:FecR/PupR family sigma factor regulator n=1 Tax=Steroidobacter sp. TaxID=1978227 RepID=UPI001A38C163